MNAFARAALAVFADRNVAQDAEWKEMGVGPGVPVRVVKRAPDEVVNFGDAQIASDSTIMELLVSEVPSLDKDDHIVIGDETFLVRGEPLRDADRLIWTVEVGPCW